MIRFRVEAVSPSPPPLPGFNGAQGKKEKDIIICNCFRPRPRVDIVPMKCGTGALCIQC